MRPKLLPEGWDLCRPLVVVLLQLGYDPVWDDVLSERCGLHQRQQGTVRVSVRHHAVWQRRQAQVLRGWSGVRAALPVGLKARDRIAVRQRNVDVDHTVCRVGRGLYGG
jgi:hypothetical protein